MEVGAFFIFSAFFAGLLTFLAPCTLPIVPAYLGYISGVVPGDFEHITTAKRARRKILVNGVFFILGFTVVFVLLGILAGFVGQGLAEYKLWLSRIGGLVVILFGFFMLGAVTLPYLGGEHRFKIASYLPKGTPVSAFLIGGSFAFGWTPCIGPILGTILFLVGANGTVLEGGFLLFVFSVGLALPFLLIAFFFSESTKYIENISKYLSAVSVIGGIFLIILGSLLLTGNFDVIVRYGFELFDFINYNSIQNYL